MAKGSLTAAGVERMKPPASGQIDRFDAGFPGLALRVGKTGRKSWVFFYRTGGKQRRMTLGTYPALSLADAREAWRAAREAVAAGRDPAAEKTAARQRQPDTVQAVAEAFIEKYARPRNRTADEVARMFARHLYPELGDRDITTITKRDILDMLDAAEARGAKVAVNRILANVRKLFAWAVERDIIEASPVAAVKAPAPETPRDRVLTDTELVAFWKAADTIGYPFGPIFQLLLLTAQRRDEVAAALWAEFDLKAGAWEMPGARTKNGRAHIVPLAPEAIQILERIPRRAGSVLLFPSAFARSPQAGPERPVSGFGRAKQRLDTAMLEELQKANPEAQLAPWRLHDLRRTAATGMARIGIGPHVVEAVLNHASGFSAGVAGTYNRYSYADEKRAALDAWAAFAVKLTAAETEQKGVATAV